MGGQESKSFIYNESITQNKQLGFSHIYRNSKFKNQLTMSPDSSLRTYRDVALKSCLEKFPNKNLAGRIIVKKEIKDGVQVQNRQVQPFTYKECFEKGQMLGKAILGLKLQFKEPTHGMKFIGIYAKNRVEWLFADLACTLYGLTSIPLYDTLGIQNLSYCLKQTEMTSLFLSADTLKVLLALKDHGSLKNLILFDKIDQQTVKKANSLGFNVLDFETLIAEGKKFTNINYKDIVVEPKNIHTFSYTSGTTGPPKGAMLSHQNFVAFLAAFNNHPAKFHQDDTYLSFLPLPHVFERVCICACVFAGTFVAFYSGDVTKIKNDAQCVKPTLFIAVPRLFNKIVEKVEQGFNQKTGIAKCLVNSGVSSKIQNIQKSGNYKSGFYDSVIFSKTKQAFGGRVRLMVSGSAPISKKTFEFMEMIMCCPLYQGYGQTQNTAGAFIRSQNDPVLGHVGPVVSSLEFKLSDIPEMKYTADDKDQQGRSTPRGQIWLRGPAVFAGYYKMKEQTEETITKEGWLKTGDVGMLLPDSRGMKIIDRKKNIFKLQQGEYVAPDKVQAAYLKCPYVQQIFLHGQSTHNFCVAIIKPHKDHLMQLANKHNIKGSYEQLVNNKEIKLILIKELFAEGKKGGLNSLEQAKNIYLQKLPFMEKNILTNTMKLQRFQAKNVYKNIIEDLYREGQLSVK